MSIEPELLRKIVEAALMAAGKPLSIAQLQLLFDEDEKPSKEEFSAAFEDIQTDCEERGFELLEVASGWRFQVKQDFAKWVGRLWEEKPQKYSRALLETLSLVAYRQPITRGDIEQIRGVAVSSHIMKSLLERDWVKVVGHRDVPGRPSMYATTKDFLDYFNLKSLEELPTLAEIRDLDSLNQEFNLDLEAPPTSLEFTEDEEPNVDNKDELQHQDDINDEIAALEDDSSTDEEAEESSEEIDELSDEESDTDVLNEEVLEEEPSELEAEPEIYSEDIIESVDTEKENSNIE